MMLCVCVCSRENMVVVKCKVTKDITMVCCKREKMYSDKAIRKVPTDL